MATSQTIRIRGATPLSPRVEADETLLPGRMVNWPFVMVHYPEGWRYYEDRGFLPELSEIVSKPGVNGVSQDARTLQVNNSLAIAGSMKKGGTIINPADPRLGDWRNYVVFYECQGGGRHYCFMGMEYEMLPGGRVRDMPSTTAYDDFRTFLRDSGYVQPMAESVYSQIEELENRAYERLARRAQGGNPYHVEAVEKKAARIAKMRAAWDEYRATPAPTTDPAAGAVQRTPIKAKPRAATVPVSPDAVARE